MALTIPLTVPKDFNAGDTVKFRVSHGDFLPADGWTLYFEFGRPEEKTIQITGTDNGDQTHLITITPAVSVTFNPGRWFYQGYVSDGTDRYTIRQGEIEVHPDFATTSNVDTRSHARTVLDAIEAVMESRATETQLSISIAGESITLLSPEELIRWRSFYKAEVEMEDRAQKIADGLGARRIVTRFRR